MRPGTQKRGLTGIHRFTLNTPRAREEQLSQMLVCANVQPSLGTTFLRHTPTQLFIIKGDASHKVDFCFPSPAQ